jgi:hypothetical protein
MTRYMEVKREHSSTLIIMECVMRLYIFSGHHLLAALLRPSNVDPAAGALSELQRIIGIIRGNGRALEY